MGALLDEAGVDQYAAERLVARFGVRNVRIWAQAVGGRPGGQ